MKIKTLIAGIGLAVAATAAYSEGFPRQVAPDVDLADGKSIADSPEADVPPVQMTDWQSMPVGTIVEVHPAATTSQVEGAREALFVRYTSTNVLGEKSLASGIVLLPELSSVVQGQWPLVVYGHMTTGGADACAPSHGVEGSTELRRMQQGDSVARELLSRGVVVARPDYEGLGEDGPHPYLRGDSLARAMRDMASAVAQHWTDIGSHWVAAGHSEGGVAALNAGSRLHPSAKGLVLDAVVAITPVTQLENLINIAKPLPVTGPGVKEAVALAALVLKGISTEDPDFERLILTEGGLSERAKALWPDLERLCLADLSQNESWGGLPPQALLGPRGSEAAAEMIRALRQDDVRWLPLHRDMPVRIDAGLLDAVALLPFTEQLVREYRQRGYPVTFARWPAAHSPTADMAAADIAEWIMQYAFNANLAVRSVENDPAQGLRGGAVHPWLILLLGVLKLRRYSRRSFIRVIVLGLGITVVGCQDGQDSTEFPLGNSDDVSINSDPMDPQRLHGWVKQLVAFQPRWAGYPQERLAADWLTDRLSAAGLDAKTEPYAFRKWQLNDWSVQLNVSGQNEPLNSFPMWSSRGGTGEAELVDVGLGTELELLARDLKGKAVVVTGRALLNVFATYPDTYHRAAELGAVAMFVSSDAPDNLIRPTSSSQNYLDDNAIPAFQMGSQDLARMRQAAHQGGRVSWKLDAQHEDGLTHDVVATLPGSGELEGSIMISAHFDAWFAGALDNATGVSGLIGLAEHFASLSLESRPRDMIFIGVTGHDAGYPHGGMSHWLQTHQQQVPDLELYINLDHLAAKAEEHVTTTGIIDMLGINIERPGDEERALFTTNHLALQRIFMPHILSYGLLPAVPLPTVPDVNANGDLEGAMGILGVPSVNLTMATPHYHTEDDTPDRIPAEQLSRAVMAHRDFITDVMRLSRAQIRSPL